MLLAAALLLAGVSSRAMLASARSLVYTAVQQMTKISIDTVTVSIL